MRTARLLFAASLILPASACKKSSIDESPRDLDRVTTPQPTPPPKPAPAPPAPTLPTAEVFTDAQVFAIGATAHQGEIDAGKLAMTKATSADVKAFAKMMVDDHGQALADGQALAAKLKITPEDSELATTLETAGGTGLAQLAALDASAFDAAYMAAQVKGHQDVLDLLDRTLIPSAQNAELKQALQALRVKVAEHLDHAKMVEAGLKQAS